MVGVYNRIPNSGKVVPYKPIGKFTQADWKRIVEIWGKPMSITEFCFTSRKIFDEK